jgi:hypothetical protein
LREAKVAAYKKAVPVWGAELTGSVNGLGSQPVSPIQGTIPARAFSIQADYQPPFIQQAHLGVLGFGPSLAMYPIIQDLFNITQAKAVDNFASFWSWGGQVRYQARFFREQPLVPVASYQVQSLSYQFTGYNRYHTTLKGPTFGLWFLLNILDTTSAANFYNEGGVSRSYLIAELRQMSASDPQITVSGSSFYFGLRVEF